jgi:hypothetical protein
VRLYIDGQLKVDQRPFTAGINTDVDLSAGLHEIKLEYFENGGAASVSLWWEQCGETVSCGEVFEGSCFYMDCVYEFWCGGELVSRYVERTLLNCLDSIQPQNKAPSQGPTPAPTPVKRVRILPRARD